MDVKLIVVLIVTLVLAGCGTKDDEGSYRNAPEVSKRITPEESLKRRGMSQEEINNERNAQAASMGGGAR